MTKHERFVVVGACDVVLHTDEVPIMPRCEILIPDAAMQRAWRIAFIDAQGRVTAAFETPLGAAMRAMRA